MAFTAGEWIFTIIIGLMLLFAVFSNSLVVFCVARYRKLRTVTNVFISNLAISDILLAGFLMPQKLHDISHAEDFYEGDALCRMVNFCPVFVITSSIYTLVAVSFERRRAIIHSNSVQLTIAQLAKVIPVIWVFGLLVSIPTLLEYSVNTISKGQDNATNETLTYISCGSQHVEANLTIANAIFLILVSYIIPVVLMFRNYLEVAFFVWKKGREIQNNPGPARRNQPGFHLFKNRIKLVKMLVIVAVIFAISWLPFFIALLYAKVTRNDASEDAGGFLNLFLILLATFSTAYNVVLYVIFNPSFRTAIVCILRCKQVTEGHAENIVATVQLNTQIKATSTTCA